MAQSFEAWWAGLGPIARYSVIIPTVLALAVTLGFLSPMHLILMWDPIFDDFEIWRLVSAACFFGKFSFPFLMNTAMFVIYQQRHEEFYGARMCDHVYMLVVILLVLYPIAYFLGMMLLSFAFTMAIVWVWCKRNESAVLSLYGFAFKAQYFPFILLLFHLLLGNSIVDDIVGIVVGHAFLFLKDILPDTNGIRLLDTPKFVEDFFPNSAQTVHGVHIPNTRQAPQQPQARPLGTGRRLGGI